MLLWSDKWPKRISQFELSEPKVGFLLVSLHLSWNQQIWLWSCCQVLQTVLVELCQEVKRHLENSGTKGAAGANHTLEALASDPVEQSPSPLHGGGEVKCTRVLPWTHSQRDRTEHRARDHYSHHHRHHRRSTASKHNNTEKIWNAGRLKER